MTTAVRGSKRRGERERYRKKKQEKLNFFYPAVPHKFFLPKNVLLLLDLAEKGEDGKSRGGREKRRG